MIRIFTAFALALCFVCTAFAQQDTENRPTLATEITVRDNVSAQAVLIPQTDARRIFGKEIANNYAVIEVNVGNKSPDAALIIHGIFIDYSRWALSGTLNQQVATTAEDAARNRFSTFQASTRSSHVASAEYRVVRGQLLDAQVWTKRNLIVRLVTVVGNVAGASAFKFSESAAKWVAVGTGVVVPGVSTAWPDSTIEQLNRVSDLGFRTNKLIPKQSAEVIVCFFPIDRFLTPGFRKLFLKSPALFFAPLQMLVDKTMQKDVAKVLASDLGIDATKIGAPEGEVLKTLQGHLQCYVRLVREMNYGAETSETTLVQQMNQNAAKTCLDEFGLEETTINNQKSYQVKSDPVSKQKFARFLALDYIGQVSLNKVNVTVDGAMTIETTTLAARIEDISFDKVNGCGDNQAECFWAFQVGGGVRTGVINGSYLTGGNVTIEEANDLGITEVKTISDGSSDQKLRFSFKLSKDIPNGTTLTFKVTKPKPGSDTTVDSPPHLIQINPPIGTPTISGVELNNSTLTVNGSGLATKALAVKLRLPNGNVLENLSLTTVENTKLVLEIPADQKTPGCWKVLVTAGGRDANVLERKTGNMFEVPPSPTLTSAVRGADRIVVNGTGLVDTRLCGEGLTFQLVKVDATDVDTPVAAEIISWTSASRVELALPDQVREGSWEVQVLLRGQQLGETPLTP